MCGFAPVIALKDKSRRCVCLLQHNDYLDKITDEQVDLNKLQMAAVCARRLHNRALT